MSLDRLYFLNQKISEADNLTIKEELEAQKRLDISTKTLASALISVLRSKNIELQVDAIEEKLKNISKDNV